MSSREVKKTQPGIEFQRDLLTKEVRRLRKTLSKQIGLFDGLINNTAEPETVEQELEKLNRNFAELSSASDRLSKLVTQEMAQQLNDAVIMEGNSVQRIENVVKGWLKAKDKVHSRVYETDERREPTTEHEGDMRESQKRMNVGLTIEFMSKHSKLEKQIGLWDEIFMTNDTLLIGREMRKLKQVYAEVCEMSVAAREGLSAIENTKILNVMKTTGDRVEKIMEAAEELTSKDEEESIISQVSRRSMLSARSEMIGKRHCIFDELKIKESDERSLRSEPNKRHNTKTQEDEYRYQHKYKQSARKRDKSWLKESHKKKTSMSEKSWKSDASRLSNHIAKKTHQITESKDALQMFENSLAAELSDIFMRIKEKIELIKNMIHTSDIKGIQQNIHYLGELQKKRETSVLGLYNILPEEEAQRLAEKVTIDDSEISEIKELAGRLIVEKLMSTEEGEEVLDKVSQRSKPSQRTGASLCSTRDNMSDCFTEFSRHRQKDAEDHNAVQIIKERTDVQRENLRERFSMFQHEFKDQKHRCVELIRSSALITSAKEVQRLEERYQTMAETAIRLREQLPSIEADDINLMIETEDTEVFEVKKMIIKRMAEGDEDHRKEKRNFLYTRTEDVKDEEIHTENNRELKREMSKIRIRLDNQKDLIDDLLMTNDKELISRELQTLDKVYNDFVAIAALLRDKSTEEDADEMSKIIAEEDNNVFLKKKIVLQCLRTSNNSEGNKKTDSCLLARVPQDTEVRKRETGERKEKEELNTDVRTTKTIIGGDEKMKEESTENSNLMRLNELMVQTLKLQAAPKVDIDTFRGDPLEYTYFIENFKDVVENLVDNPRQRLLRLLKFTEGDAKDLIKHCVYEKTESCYSMAISLLEKEYGNPYTISCAYLEKLKSWPQIKSNDGVALKALYRFLLRCSSYQKKGNIDLNSPLTIRSIQLSLPVNMQDSWTTRVSKIRKKKMQEATFFDFVEFIDEWCQSSNDPVYSRGGFKDKKHEKEEKLKACATEIEEKKAGSESKDKDKSQDKSKCPLCGVQHDLDECSTFTEKTARDKKSFLFKAKMCFCCYGKDHLASKCNAKRICKTCGEAHPTGLHGVSFKVSAVGSGMCIVPVRLKHKTWKDKEIEVYAMLDECSEGTFISESLLDELEDVKKRNASVFVETVNHKGFADAYAVKDLIVRGSKEFEERYDKLEEIKLPETHLTKDPNE